MTDQCYRLAQINLGFAQTRDPGEACPQAQPAQGRLYLRVSDHSGSTGRPLGGRGSRCRCLPGSSEGVRGLNPSLQPAGPRAAADGFSWACPRRRPDPHVHPDMVGAARPLCWRAPTQTPSQAARQRLPVREHSHGCDHCPLRGSPRAGRRGAAGVPQLCGQGAGICTRDGVG